MNTENLELYESLENQLKTIEHLTQNALRNIAEYQSQLESYEAKSEIEYNLDDDFDFGISDEETIIPPPAKERLCQQCLEELGMNDIDTQSKKLNSICEWCVEKRAMAQAKVIESNNVSEQVIKKAESFQTIVVEKREFKTSVKIVFWILVVALIAIAFT